MRTISATDITAVSVRLGNGSVTLTGSENDTVSGDVHSSDPQAEQALGVETFGHELRIASPRQSGLGGLFEAEVHVRLSVPTDTDLVVTTGSGDVTTDVPLGRVEVKSGSGDLRLSGVRRLTSSSGSGDVVVLQVGSDGAEITTGSGDIRVDDSGSRLQLRTASGDVKVGNVHGEVEAKTASGDLGIANTAASVTARTASGDVTIGVADPLPAWLDLHSASGEVDIAIPPTGQPSPDEAYVSIYVRSGSGDIQVTRAR